MYCLDTSVIIAIFDGVESIGKKLEKISSKNIYINPIILCELYKGAIHSKVTEKRLKFIEDLLQKVDILEFNEYSCKIFSEDYFKFKKLGKPIKDNDLIISSICKAHNKILITMDKKHFENIPDLISEIWG